MTAGSSWRAARRRLATAVLFTAIAAAPLPFGSRDPATLAFWCVLLGLAITFAPLHGLGTAHHAILSGIAAIAAAYLVVLHEQLAGDPWIATVHPIWAQASAALGSRIEPSVSIARGEPLFALGAPLANMLALTLGLIVGTDRHDAHRALRVLAWSGAAYALYGIGALMIDPHAILWRVKTAYVGNLTATFINRNTAATYFGSCAVVWLLLLLERARAERPLPATANWQATLAAASERLLNPGRLLVPCVGLLLVVAALFLTVSRAGIVISLFVLVSIALLRLRERVRTPRHAVLAVAGAAVVGSLLVAIMGGGLGGRLHAQGISDDSRLATWRSTLAMISDRPWFGTGLGTFAWAYPHYRSDDLPLQGIWDAAHSTPLELAAEAGLPLAGLIAAAWAAAIGVLAAACRNGSRGRVTPLAALSIAVIALVHSSLDFSLQVAGYSIVCFAVVGVGLARACPTADRPDPAHAPGDARGRVAPVRPWDP